VSSFKCIIYIDLSSDEENWFRCCFLFKTVLWWG
jgi:hypothetical protein